MTPLYSKETAEELAEELKDRCRCGTINTDASAIIRLIENGNEANAAMQEAMNRADVYGDLYSRDLLGDLLKKIKGEI
jgi:hypothetical protein